MNIVRPITAAVRWFRRRRDERAAREQWEALPLGERIDIRRGICIVETPRLATPFDVELVQQLNETSAVFRAKVEAAGLGGQLADVLALIPNRTARRLMDRTSRP